MLTDNGQPDAETRRLAKLLRELLASQSFGSLADLVAVLKAFAAQHHVPYGPDSVTGALRLVGSNRRLLR
jgi:hypothetical protein